MAAITKTSAPKYFPNIICQVVNGFVFNISIVPAFISSEKLRMVTAGIKKINIQGERVKKGDKSANPLFKILYSPSKTQRNKIRRDQKRLERENDRVKEEVLKYTNLSHDNILKFNSI